jgi:hypothetical protein
MNRFMFDNNTFDNRTQRKDRLNTGIKRKEF